MIKGKLLYKNNALTKYRTWELKMADVKKQESLSNELASKLWECANNLRGNMDAQ